MLYKGLFALICLILSPQITNADIYTPVSVNLNHEEFSDVLNRYFKEGFSLNDTLKDIPKIAGLKMTYSKINYQAKVNPVFEVNSNGTLNIDSEVPFAFFEVFDLNLHHKMVRRVGSVKVNINTKIECDYLKISLMDKIRIEAEGEFIKGKPQLKKTFLPSNLGFKIEYKNCIAPSDFENFLPELAIEWLNSKEGQNEIISFLNNEVVNNFWTDLKKGLEIEFLGRKIYLALLQINNTVSNLNINFMIRWPKEETFYLNLKEPLSLSSLAIKSNDLNYIFKNWITGGCFDLVFYRKDISGIEKLFGSRLYQFFIWGDLSNFRKDVDFNLKVRICLEDLKLQKIYSKTLNFSQQSSVYIQMNFIGSGGKELPYMYFWSKSKGEINLNLTPDGLAFGLAKSTFDFSYKYHPQMYTWRKSKASGGPALKAIMSIVLPELEALRTPVLEEFKELFQNKRTSYESEDNFELLD